MKEAMNNNPKVICKQAAQLIRYPASTKPLRRSDSNWLQLHANPQMEFANRFSTGLPECGAGSSYGVYCASYMLPDTFVVEGTQPGGRLQRRNLRGGIGLTSDLKWRW